MAALIQLNDAPPPVPYADAVPLASNLRPTQSWTPSSSIDEKHPHVLRNWHPRNCPVASSRLSQGEPVPSRTLPLTNRAPLNRSVRGTREDTDTIVSSLDCSEGSFSEISCASAFPTNAAIDRYQEILKVSRRPSDKRDKNTETNEKQSEQATTRQSSVKLDPSDYNSLLAGRRKSTNITNESKLAEYESLLADKTVSPRKTGKQKNALSTVSQKVKELSTIMTSCSSTLGEDRTFYANTYPSGYTVKSADSSASGDAADPTKRASREKAFKMEPVCLSSTSLDEFQKYSRATNDPVRAQLIEKQLKPLEMKKKKLNRPKREVNEWTKSLTANESRYSPAHQSHTNRFRSFDERLMTSESEDRIL